MSRDRGRDGARRPEPPATSATARGRRALRKLPVLVTVHRNGQRPAPAGRQGRDEVQGTLAAEAWTASADDSYREPPTSDDRRGLTESGATRKPARPADRAVEPGRHRGRPAAWCGRAAPRPRSSASRASSSAPARPHGRAPTEAASPSSCRRADRRPHRLDKVRLIDVNRKAKSGFSPSRKPASSPTSAGTADQGPRAGRPLGVPLGAVLLGQQAVAGLRRKLRRHGADKVYLAEHEASATTRPPPTPRLVCELIDAAQAADRASTAPTTTGRDLAPRVASRLQRRPDRRLHRPPDRRLHRRQAQQGLQEPAAPDSPGLRRQHHRHDRQPRPLAADGHRPRGRHAACPRPTRSAPARSSTSHRPSCDRGYDAAAQDHRSAPRSEKVNLKAARIIVAGGAGVGSKDNFRLIWDLANASAPPSAPAAPPSTSASSTTTTRSARPARPSARRCTSPAASAAPSSTAPAWTGIGQDHRHQHRPGGPDLRRRPLRHRRRPERGHPHDDQGLPHEGRGLKRRRGGMPNFFTRQLGHSRVPAPSEHGPHRALQEDGFAPAQDFAYAPRDSADAVDNYGRILAIVGDIAATSSSRAPKAPTAPASTGKGEVCYAPASPRAGSTSSRPTSWVSLCRASTAVCSSPST